jgi:hypothetical protein
VLKLSLIVMPGFIPGTHVPATAGVAGENGVDHRDEPGDDDYDRN